jgi:hypothetical protein
VAIVGSWFATTATGLKQLITFHADGTVLRSIPGEVSIAPARAPHTAANGVWRYLGNERFGVALRKAAPKGPEPKGCVDDLPRALSMSDAICPSESRDSGSVKAIKCSGSLIRADPAKTPQF